jgi:hypothetical protein
MKAIFFAALLVASAYLGGGCSRSDNQPDSAVQATPNANLKADAERLRQATAKAAEQRKRALEQKPSPTPSPN